MFLQGKMILHAVVLYLTFFVIFETRASKIKASFEEYGKAGDDKVQDSGRFQGNKLAANLKLSNLTSNASESSVRLVGGGSAYGRVEIFHDNDWGTICDDAWYYEEAQVTCRQLGFPLGKHGYATNAGFGEGTGPIWLDNMACNGGEDELSSCTNAGWGVHNCAHDADAGVYCDRGNHVMRLVDGGGAHGRVEVNYEGTWGTVCHDSWSINGFIDAKVICHQLGFPRDGQHGWLGYAGFGPGTGPIWLDNVVCQGREQNINHCAHTGWGVSNCDHTEDAGVYCDRGNHTLMRLVDGGETYGRVEVNYDGSWGTVCHDSWSIYGSIDAKVICHQLGFPRDGQHGWLGYAGFGQGTGPIWLDNVVCQGTEQDINYCAHNGWAMTDCDHTEDASVYCDRGNEITVRLRDGGEAYGRVEIVYEGIWGTLCHDNWSLYGKANARVICTQLGFPADAQHGYLGLAGFGQGIGPIWLDNVVCLGGEKNLKHCVHNGWGVHDCDHSEDAGVYCIRDSNTTLRLSDGGEAYGRVEVLYEGMWGTMCHDGWSAGYYASPNVKVICHQLGFPKTGQHGWRYSAGFGPGTGSVWLDNVACLGGEDDVGHCSHNGWGVTDCNHDEDVGVYCDRGIDLQVRLVGGGDAYGRVEILYEGVWGTICHDYWDNSDAKVVCQQLGFPRDELHGAIGYAGFGQGVGPIWMESVGCDGRESNIRSCPHLGFGVHDCNHGEDAGVYCLRGNGTEVRLVNGGEAYGRVEVNYEGFWGTICQDSWGTANTKVICRQLGFPSSGQHGYAYYAWFGEGTGKVWLDDVACYGNENNIDRCNHLGWGIGNCGHNEDIGVWCDREIDREIRLVGGGEAYGRVEVNYEGIWGTICDDSWDKTDAKVVCRQLGFPESSKHSATYSAGFGEGTGKIWLDDVTCSGSEGNIQLCGHRGWDIDNCGHEDDAGVYCDPGTDIVVRLADGDAVSGRVEILYEDLWGTLCHDYFDNLDAKVICRQLGFPDGNHLAIGGGYFLKGTGKIWIESLACSGSEDNINECGFPGWNYHNCDHSEDAGVICDPGPTTDPPRDPTTTQADLPVPSATAEIPGEAVECENNHMTVFVSRSIIGDTDGSELYFYDKSCTGSNYNSTHVRIETALSQCKTAMEVRGDYVVFSNLVHNDARPATPGSVITRDRAILIPVECYISRDGLGSLSFDPDTSSIIYYDEGYGEFSFQLQLYHDETYAKPYEPKDYPVAVKLQDNLYFEASVSAEDGLEIFVDTCAATVTVNPYSSPQYNFISDGCIKDNTLEFFPSGDPMIEHFGLEAFNFVGSNSTVYVHCFLSVCDAFNASSRCSLGCQPAIKKRDVSGGILQATTTNMKSYLMTQGPLKLLRNDDNHNNKVNFNTKVVSHNFWGWNFNIVSLALAFTAFCVSITAITLVKTKIRQLEQFHYNMIPQNED